MWSYTYGVLWEGAMRDGQIKAGDVRAAADIVRVAGTGSAGKRYQCAGGRITSSAGGPGAARQRPGAEAHAAGEVRIKRQVCQRQ